jgi:hypothetical protein
VSANFKGPIATFNPRTGSHPPRIQIHQTLHRKYETRAFLEYSGVPLQLLDHILVTALLIVTDLQEWRIFDNRFMNPRLPASRSARQDFARAELSHRGALSVTHDAAHSTLPASEAHSMPTGRVRTKPGLPSFFDNPASVSTSRPAPVLSLAQPQNRHPRPRQPRPVPANSFATEKPHLKHGQRSLCPPLESGSSNEGRCVLKRRRRRKWLEQEKGMDPEMRNLVKALTGYRCPLLAEDVVFDVPPTYSSIGLVGVSDC